MHIGKGHKHHTKHCLLLITPCAFDSHTQSRGGWSRFLQYHNHNITIIILLLLQTQRVDLAWVAWVYIATSGKLESAWIYYYDQPPLHAAATLISTCSQLVCIIPRELQYENYQDKCKRRDLKKLICMHAKTRNKQLALTST